jgi:hypothetical protein
LRFGLFSCGTVLQIIRPQNAKVAHIQPAVGDDRLRPCVGIAAIRLTRWREVDAVLDEANVSRFTAFEDWADEAKAEAA